MCTVQVAMDLSVARTHFWRYNKKGQGADHLATLEAIYHFVKQYHMAETAAGEGVGGGEGGGGGDGDPGEEPGPPAYDGRFDDLLYFFVHQYNVIQGHYQVCHVTSMG